MNVYTATQVTKLISLIGRIELAPAEWQAIRVGSSAFTHDAQDPARLQIINTLLQDYLPDTHVQLFCLANGESVLITHHGKLADLTNLAQQIKLVVGDVKQLVIFDLAKEFETFSSWVESVTAEENEEIAEAPIAREPVVDLAHAKKVLAERAARKNIVIQVVEDDPFTQKLVGNVLSDYSVIKSDDVVDAIEAYHLNAPDLVFLDINLPNGSGHDVLQKIKQFDKDAHVIMLSSNRSMNDVQKALQYGAKGFVAKPFPKDKLLNCVKAIAK